MAETTSPMKGLAQLEGVLEEYLVKKAPGIPANIKELIVKFAPWLTIIGVVLGVPTVLTVLGLGSMMSTFGLGYGVGYGMMGGLGLTYFVGIAFLVATMVLEALAIPGLMKRQMKGWRFMFYAVIVNAVSTLVSFNIVGLILGTLIGMYVLFQVKSYYK